jgi:predicted RNase H-like HicB family nuclease
LHVVALADFPGAVTAARTIDEAVEMAQEALALHVEGMLAEGETIPEPSKFDQVRDEPKFSDGIPVLVPLKTDALVMRVNVTLPAAILRRIDEHAEELGLTRSGFLAEAARHELDNDPVRRWLSHSFVKTVQDKMIVAPSPRAPTLQDWVTVTVRAPETLKGVLDALMQSSVQASAEGELDRAQALITLARAVAQTADESVADVRIGRKQKA